MVCEIPAHKRVQLRVSGHFVEILGYGSRETGACTVRRLSDGMIFHPVYYWELVGNGLKVAFYGTICSEKEARCQRMASRRRTAREKALKSDTENR